MASNTVVSIMIVTILINVLSGVLMVGVVDSEGNRVFDRADSPLKKQKDVDNYSEDFEGELQDTVKPAGSVEDKGDQTYRIMQAISLGFIYKFVNIMDTYMYGIVEVFDAMFSDTMNDDLRVLLFGDEDPATDKNINFGILKLVISIGYVLLGIKLLTGTDVLS